MPKCHTLSSLHYSTWFLETLLSQKTGAVVIHNTLVCVLQVYRVVQMHLHRSIILGYVNDSLFSLMEQITEFDTIQVEYYYK